VPAPDRRTVKELLADGDALARETLLDNSASPGPADGEDMGPTRPVSGSTVGGAFSNIAGGSVRTGSDGAAARSRGGRCSECMGWRVAWVGTDGRTPPRDCSQPIAGWRSSATATNCSSCRNSIRDSSPK
jgi:hypothetical protein